MAQGTLSVPAEVFEAIRASTAPGMNPEIVEKILRGYFSGKRDALRTYKFLDSEVSGHHGTFRAMAVDISRTGVLLRITDPEFATQDEMNHLMPYTARVWFHFEGGFTIRFSRGAVVTTANVVRVTGYVGRGNSLILLGCRFDRDLAQEECAMLGIDHSDDRPPGTGPANVAVG
jgi:hypothetical protein